MLLTWWLAVSGHSAWCNQSMQTQCQWYRTQNVASSNNSFNQWSRASTAVSPVQKPGICLIVQHFMSRRYSCHVEFGNDYIVSPICHSPAPQTYECFNANVFVAVPRCKGSQIYRWVHCTINWAQLPIWLGVCIEPLPLCAKPRHSCSFNNTLVSALSIFAQICLLPILNGSIRVQCSRSAKQDQFVRISLSSSQAKSLQHLYTLPSPLTPYILLYQVLLCWTDILYVGLAFSVRWCQQHIAFCHFCHFLAIHLYEISRQSTDHFRLCDLIAPCRALCSLQPGSKQWFMASVTRHIEVVK